MAAFQQTIIVGNVGRDVNFKFTQGGIAVADFSVAVTERFGKNPDGSAKEKTTWFRCTAWRETAELIKTLVVKGQQIMVIGSIGDNPYIDKNNAPANTLELTIRSFQLLGKRDDNGGSAYVPETVGAGVTDLSDIPF